MEAAETKIIINSVPAGSGPVRGPAGSLDHF